ncbi:MAG: hypothetical protein JEZ02_03445 [Desulfatibacillum sp.]|nr:hypothetical protein [Desulfatibacillum sp.]
MQVVSGIRCDSEWCCQPDDEANGIYSICNYFPLEGGNFWKYNTGARVIISEKKDCNGYTGIQYGTSTYEYSLFMDNGKNGLLMNGCEYEQPEGNLRDMGTAIKVANEQMSIGDQVQTTFEGGAIVVNSTFQGFENVTVPAGTFNALKLRLDIDDEGGGGTKCDSFVVTLWLAKGIGPVKIARTNPVPANCLGCVFLCNPENSLTILNTSAILTRAAINGQVYPQ